MWNILYKCKCINVLCIMNVCVYWILKLRSVDKRLQTPIKVASITTISNKFFQNAVLWIDMHSFTFLEYVIKRVNNLSKVYLILSSWPSQFRQILILVEIHPLLCYSFCGAPFSLIFFSVMFLPRNAILHPDAERTWPPHLVGCPVKLIETNFHFCVGNKIITSVICS